MATSSFFYNGSNAPQDNPNTPVETTGSSDNTVKTSFFYEGISPPSQTSVAELLAQLDVKLASAQQFAEAASLSASQAHAYANNAEASENAIASLLNQANIALSQAQAAQAAASATLIQINAAVTTTNNNVSAAQVAQAAAEAAKVLAQTAATNAQTQATNAATSASAAASSASAASGSASTATTKATEAASSASAAATSATSAASSASSATSSATTATNAATAAGTSATAAANSASAASTAGSNASASATAAATSASNAATSATNAAASATAAATSATNAANSATAAATTAANLASIIPSQTGNAGKFLKTNGTTTSWAIVDAFPSQGGNAGKFLSTDGTTTTWATVSLNPATPSVRGLVFGATDSMVYAPPATISYNSFIMTHSIDGTPINTISGNSASAYGANAYVIAQAIINSQIQVGQNLKLVCQVDATGLQTLVDLGTITSATYNLSISGSWTYDISYTNPNGWTGEGLTFDYRQGIHVYDFVIGGTPAENALLGYQAGAGITTGGENVVIGANAGSDIRSGRNNVVIGNAAQGSAPDVSNEVTLGNSLHTKTRLFGALAMGGSSVGTSGQVLTSQGSGTAPIWAPAGSVTSVNMSVPTGLSVSGGPITSSGTLAVTYATGYSIPTTAKQTNWDTAYGWGNHASVGYLTGITSGQVTGALGYTPENPANKNAANGYAGLDSSGLVPSSLLPSYVDDVLEYVNLAGFPGTGETGKIYVAKDTNKIYRWSGSAYIEISASPGSTDAVTEGSVNLYFTNARARSAISATGSLSYNSTTGVLSYTQPTNVSTFTNDSGYITSTALSPYLTSATAASTYVALAGSYANPSWITSLAYSKLTGAPTAVSGFTNDAGYATTTYVDTQDALKLNAANPSYTGTLTGGTGVINIGSGQFYKDASGNVGFGTTTMVAKMNVAQTFDSVLIQATNGTVGHRVSYILSGVAYTGTSNAYPLAIMTVGTEAIRIDTSQRVGIGKTNPSTLLDVNGVITATGGNSTNWNTAYGWGNHASAGYLTSASALNGANITSGTVTTTQLAATLDLGVLP